MDPGPRLSLLPALRLGFVQEVVPAAEVFERALSWAERIAAAAPLATQETKRSSQIFVDDGPDAAVEAFTGQLRRIAASEDFAEGVGLSPPVSAAVPVVADEIEALLTDLGKEHR